MENQPVNSGKADIVVGHVTQEQANRVFTKKVEQTTYKTGMKIKKFVSGMGWKFAYCEI